MEKYLQLYPGTSNLCFDFFFFFFLFTDSFISNIVPSFLSQTIGTLLQASPHNSSILIVPKVTQRHPRHLSPCNYIDTVAVQTHTLNYTHIPSSFYQQLPTCPSTVLKLTHSDPEPICHSDCTVNFCLNW